MFKLSTSRVIILNLVLLVMLAGTVNAAVKGMPRKALLDRAERGELSAQHRLAVHYMHRNAIDQAVYWAHRAASRGYVRSLEMLQHAARKGHPEAQYMLGDLLLLGNGITQSVPEAIRLFKTAALREHAAAMVQLGELYASDEYVPADPGQSVDWYTKAAAAGSAEAMFSLGELYRSGDSVPEDLAKSICWYIHAAETGHFRAKVFLLDLITTTEIDVSYTGPVIPWLEKLAAQGDVEAQKNLDHALKRFKTNH